MSAFSHAGLQGTSEKTFFFLVGVVMTRLQSKGAPVKKKDFLREFPELICNLVKIDLAVSFK